MAFVALAGLVGLVGGCGFVAGVDFFDLDRTPGADGGPAIASDAGADARPGNDAAPSARPTRIHVMGGTDDAGRLPPRGLSYVSEIQADGSLGPWQPGPDLPLPWIYAPGIAGRDFVAMVGGISNVHGERANLVTGRADDRGIIAAFVESADAFTPPRSRAGAVVHAGTVFVLGGVDAKSAALASVQHGKVVASGVDTFTASPSLPAPRARLAAVANDTDLYVVGGSDGTTSFTDILVGRFTGNDVAAFTVAGTLPSGRVYAQAIVTAGALVVVGGEVPRALPDVLRYPVEASGALGPPTASTPLPIGTGRHQLVQHGTHLYVIGGVTEKGATTNVFVGDLTSDGYVSAWRATTALPAPLMFHTAVAL